MAKKLGRNKTLTTPVVINRATKRFCGFTITTDLDDNVTGSAIWDVPRDEGTVDRTTVSFDAAAIQALAGFDDIVDAIVTASE